MHLKDTKPVGETSPLQPESPYGRSKLMSEMMLADVAAAHPLTYGVLLGAFGAGEVTPVRTGFALPMSMSCPVEPENGPSGSSR